MTVAAKSVMLSTVAFLTITILLSYSLTINAAAAATSNPNSTIVSKGNSLLDGSGNTSPTALLATPFTSLAEGEQKIAAALNRTLLSNAIYSGSTVYVLGERLSVRTCKDDPENYCSNHHSIFLIRSTNNGSRFEKEIAIAGNITVELSAHPQIAAWGDNVYVAWNDIFSKNNRSPQIFFTKSTDNGATFIPPTTLRLAVADSAGPAALVKVTSEENTVLILFSFGPGIYAAASTNNGDNFSTPVYLGAEDWFNPSVAISGSSVYVAWAANSHASGFLNPQHSNILFKKSTDSGMTFSKAIVLQNTTFRSIGSLYNAHVFLSPSKNGDSKNLVNVAWLDFCDGTCNDLFFTRSMDGGVTFEKTATLSKLQIPFTPGSQSLQSGVSEEGNNLCFGWLNKYDSGSYDRAELAFIKSEDGGVTFADKKTLNIIANKNLLGSADYPIAFNVADVNRIFLVWIGSGDENNPADNAVPSEPKVVFRMGTDCGQTFTSPVVISGSETTFLLNNDYADVTRPNATDTFVRSQMNIPLVVADNNNVNVYWQSNSLSNTDILYSISTDRGNTFEKTVFHLTTDTTAVPEFGATLAILVLVIIAVVSIRTISRVDKSPI